MTTWIFKSALAALGLTILTACEDGQIPSFLDRSPPGKTVALSQANMAFGAVILVAPDGFCIDKGSLKQRFALMARCDKLGVPSAAAGAPLGVITVSFTNKSDLDGIPSPQQSSNALGLTQISDVARTGSSVTFHAQGAAPSEGMSERHWRGTAPVGTQVMSVALFGPEDGRAVGSEGRSILADVISGSMVGS